MYHTEACPQGAPLVFNSGASITISPYKEDFVSLDTSPKVLAHNTVTGFAQGSETLVKGIGNICVLVHTDNGDCQYIEMEDIGSRRQGQDSSVSADTSKPTKEKAVNSVSRMAELSSHFLLPLAEER